METSNVYIVVENALYSLIFEMHTVLYVIS